MLFRSGHSWKTRIASFAVDDLSVAILENPATHSGHLFQLRNDPNPVVKGSLIHWKLPVQGHVELIVADYQGKAIKSLVNQEMDAGGKQLAFDATGLPAGLYFLRMQVNGLFESIKIIVCR